MLNLQTRLQPNEKEVASKIMDGEAIMINLSTGVYHSMINVGAVIWELIEKRYSLEEIIKTITEAYDVSLAQAQADVERLAAQLIEEALVSISDGGAPTSTYQSPAPSQRVPYESPRLNTYRDMNDLLALDPPMPKIDDVPWKSPSGDS
jgi:hypothetical protein